MKRIEYLDLIVVVIALAAFVLVTRAMHWPTAAGDANAVYDTPPYESRYASARW